MNTVTISTITPPSAPCGALSFSTPLGNYQSRMLVRGVRPFDESLAGGRSTSRRSCGNLLVALKDSDLHFPPAGFA
jgi:hypothetical protein